MKQNQLSEFKRAYGSSTDDELAVQFKTSASAVRRLAVQHGLAKDKRAFPGTRKMPRWTPEEKATLAEVYASTDNLALAQQHGRSVKSIVAQANALGLKKSPERLRAMGRENVAKRRR